MAPKCVELKSYKMLNLITFRVRLVKSRSGAPAARERAHERLERRAERAAPPLRAPRATRARAQRAPAPAVRVQALLVAQLEEEHGERLTCCYF